MKMDRKLRVGVIFGGRSGEHEVSLMSARSVLSAFAAEKYEVVQIGITYAGEWLVSRPGASLDALSALEGGQNAELAPG
jgi:D-alanine-D-alanine ligase